MLAECIRVYPPERWNDPIGNYPFWQVAYHTLCFADLYLSPAERAFELRNDLHPAGWAEYNEEFPSRRFENAELEQYVTICRETAEAAFAAETQASLEAPCGFARRNFSRGELHLYNLRHIQHHTGQLSAFLRRSGVETNLVSTGGR
jgi:uncharacterized damage-inducible protein DinB